MVRITPRLCRIPVIKFRKGGMVSNRPTSSPAAGTSTNLKSCALSAPPPPISQPTVSMSTIPDIDLPARYRRQPLSQEEIDHINGGGEVLENSKDKKAPKMLGMLKIPKGVLVRGKQGPKAINLTICLTNEESRDKRKC